MKPVSETAFYCSGLRMFDAQSSRPICNDTYAGTFMDERGMEIVQRFGRGRGPVATHAARHRCIDDYLRRKLHTDPTLRVIVIGCGFDSRAFRLRHGDWLEVDEPELIDYKNARLPVASCANRLQRIAIDFSNDSLVEALAPFALDGSAVVVIEGVTMYLAPETLESTLVTLRRLFPQHEVIADLMTHRCLDAYGKNVKRIMAAMGAEMASVDDPAQPFLRAGYRQVSSESIFGLALSYQGAGSLSQGRMKGYTVRVFS